MECLYKYIYKNTWLLLHFCAMIGDRENLDLILETNEQLKNTQDAKGNTALHLAVSAHHSNCVNSLLHFFHADALIKNKDGETPLYCAVKHRAFAICQVLKDHTTFDIQLHQPHGDRNSLLVLAYRNRDMDLFRFLLEHGGDVNDMMSEVIVLIHCLHLHASLSFLFSARMSCMV